VRHPLLIGLIILILTFLTAVTLGLRRLRTWLSYILVLILLGGLLVIFIYISLLAANETHIPRTNLTKILFLSAGRLLATSIIFSSRLKTYDSKTNSFLRISPYNTQNMDWLNLLYSDHLGGITIFLVLYLLLTLIVVVTITKNDSSSLRAS